MDSVIRALLFDCDGTLVDNEPLHLRACNEVLQAHGGGAGLTMAALSMEEYRELLGLPDAALLAAALERRGRTVSPEGIAAMVEEKRAAVLRSLAAGVSPVPGIADFLRKASATYLLAVASGAWRAEVSAILGHLEVGDLFRAVVTVEDYATGKPDPAPFLTALARLNDSSPAVDPPVKPGECIVFEDSVHGVAAARAAGMRSVALTTTQSGDALRDADFVAVNYRSLDLHRLTAFFDRRAR